VALVSPPYKRYANPRIPEEASLSIVSMRNGAPEGSVREDQSSACVGMRREAYSLNGIRGRGNGRVA